MSQVIRTFPFFSSNHLGILYFDADMVVAGINDCFRRYAGLDSAIKHGGAGAEVSELLGENGFQTLQAQLCSLAEAADKQASAFLLLEFERGGTVYTHKAELQAVTQAPAGEPARDEAYRLLVFPGEPEGKHQLRFQESEAPPSPFSSFDQLLTATRSGTWKLELSSKKISWSDEVYRIFGLDKTSDQPDYDAIFDSIHPDDREYVRTKFEEHLAGSIKSELLHRIIRPNGEVRIIYEQAETRRHADGSPHRTDGLVLDVTEVYDYITRSNLYEQNLHSLFDQIPLPIIVFDSRERLVQLNQKFTELTGYTPQDFSTLSEWRRLAYPDESYRNEIVERWEKAKPGEALKTNRQLPNVDFRIRCKNGADAYAEFRHIPHHSNYIFSLTDITERTLASNRHRQQQDQLKLLSELSARFINMPPEQLDTGMNQALALVSKALGVERSFIAGLKTDEDTAAQTLSFWHTWQQKPNGNWETAHRTLEDTGFDRAGHNAQMQLLRGETITLTAPGSWLEHNERIKSLVIPLIAEDRLIGFLGFEAGGEAGDFYSYELNIPFMLADIILNISQRKAQLEQLQHTENEFSYLYESMAEGVVYQNADGYITKANPAAERLLGLSLDQMQGRASTDPRWHAVKADGTPFPGEEHPAMVTLRTGKMVENVEMGVFHPEKEKRVWIKISARPQFRPGEAKPWQVYTTFSDITAIKEQSLKLKQTNSRTEQFGQLAAIGFWEVDLEKGEANLNEVAAQIMGVEPGVSAEVSGLVELYAEDESNSRSRVEKAVSACIADGTPYDLELKLQTAAGEEKWVRTIGKGLHQNGECVAFWGSVQDITRQRETLYTLQRQSQLQQLFVRIANRFIASMPGEEDELINRSLQELGEFIGASRFELYAYDFKQESCTKTHHWYQTGFNSEVKLHDPYPLRHFSALANKHRYGSWVVIDDLDRLNPDEKIFFVPGLSKVKSFMSVPLILNNSCRGFLNLQWLEHPHSQTDDEVGLLTLFTGMLVNTYAKTDLIYALNDRQQFLTDIFENSGSLIAVKNKAGIYHTVNKKWEEVTGLNRQQVIGKNDNDLFEPETAEDFIANDNKVVQNKITIETEEKLGLGEDTRYFISVKFPVINSKEEVTGLCAIITEITELRKAEQQERQALERTTAVLQANPDLMFVIGLDLRITEYYAKDDDALLMPPDEFVGKPIYQILPRGVAGTLEEKIMLTHRTQEPQQLSYDINIQGSKFYYEARLVPYGRHEILIIVRDITSQKEGERNSRRLEFVVEESLNEIYFFDSKTYRFISANNAALRNLGYSQQELQQFTAYNIKDGYDLGKFEKLVKPLLYGTEKLLPFSARHIRKDGSLYDVFVHLQLFEYEGESLFAAFTMDITKQTKYFQAVKKQNETLRQISWVQSHVVRAPLARMKGLMDLYKEKDFEIMTEEQILAEIEKAADEFENVILDISRKTYIVDEIEREL